MERYFGDVSLVRLIVQRALAAIYLIAFLAVARQFKPLLGERGLLPVPAFLKGVRFSDAPSIFHWRYSDRLLTVIAVAGLTISASALLGLSDAGPSWLSLVSWLLLWVLYLSIVNVGQTFYAFGWESMLLEAGFFAAFLGPAGVAPSRIPVAILRWMLFRTEFGAGLIKLRHDACWRRLTCLFYHYETQPLPNPTSWFFHRLPKWMHRFAVLFSHFVQVIVPFGLFAPQPIASIAGGLIIFHQLWLIVSGNYSWLNWLTVILGVTAFSDSILTRAIPIGTSATTFPRTSLANAILYVLGGATVWLSVRPVKNLFSSNQLMNYSYNRFHLVNTYGAFGSVTKRRYEIVIEGTTDPIVTNATEWREYGFKAKPGNPKRLPPQIAPYHLRLDWLMWFLPFSVAVTENRIHISGYEVWFLRLIQRLLEGDRNTLQLLRENPFGSDRPRFVRALFYLYRYTDFRALRETGALWTRSLVDVYLPPISVEVFRKV
jgi:hypothetical protein